MSGYFFRVEKLSAGYGKRPVVQELEICVERGEILTFIGANGVGKSTVLKNITAQLAPLAGTVYLDGRSVHELSRKQLARHMAVVLTERIEGEWMSCGEVVAAGRYPFTGFLGALTDKDWRQIAQAMETVGIRHLSDRQFTALSDGQKQLTMLARALCQEPEILVLDEPTSYLDMRYKLELLSVLQRMARERGLAVIMSLHELELAQRVSHKILALKGGYIHRYGTPEEIFTPGYLKELYDMGAGSYDERSCRPELPRAEGAPQVFVIAGGGSGIPIYRRLQREGIPFATGILAENDLDYPTAADLAVEVVGVEPFASIGQEALERGIRVMESCQHVYCCVERFGEWNQANRLLLERAIAAGRLEELSWQRSL